VTIYLHETHNMVGVREDDFAALYRDADGWMARLAVGQDARLLYFAHQAHGTGHAYRVTTITAVADGAAWERLATSMQFGELHEWVTEVDACRHEVNAKLLLPVAWSPMNELDLATLPTEPAEHEPTLFMEDTGWPHVPLDEYLDFWERDYLPMLHRAPLEMRLLEIQACWVPAVGAGRRPEATLWQRVHNVQRLNELFTTELPPERKAPGTYMAEALKYRDQWESRLLRTASWSPMW
jgi:hypothetical protein